MAVQPVRRSAPLLDVSVDGLLDWAPIGLSPEKDALAWGYLSTVAVHEGELAAAGATAGGDGQRWVATVWHGSPTDGLAQVPHADEVFGGAGMPWIHGLASGGPGLVAVGTVDSHYLDDPPWSPAAVWTSPDGAAWERVAHDDEVFGDYDAAAMNDVVNTDGDPGASRRRLAGRAEACVQRDGYPVCIPGM